MYKISAKQYKKATFCFKKESLAKLNELYASFILAGENRSKSSLLEEALDLLHKRYKHLKG